MFILIVLNFLLFFFYLESAKSDIEKSEVQPSLVNVENDAGKTLKMLVLFPRIKS